MKIDENVIYKEAYEAIADEDWYFNDTVTGKEVGNYIFGVSDLARRLLDKLENKETKEEE